jgi:hypothetical protein
VPRDYVVILGNGMGRVNSKYLDREFETARDYDKKYAQFYPDGTVSWN